MLSCGVACLGGAGILWGDGADLTISVWRSPGGTETEDEMFAQEQRDKRSHVAQLAVVTGQRSAAEHRGTMEPPKTISITPWTGDIHCTQSHLLYLFFQGLCILQGTSSQLQSRAQVTLDGVRLLTTGLNMSAADGHLALLLSFVPQTSNQTWTQFSLNTALTAQFKGQMMVVAWFKTNNSAGSMCKCFRVKFKRSSLQQDLYCELPFV